ncbi:hypothetical protein Dimus_038471 [Dionaea muscipula]
MTLAASLLPPLLMTTKTSIPRTLALRASQLLFLEPPAFLHSRLSSPMSGNPPADQLRPLHFPSLGRGCPR